MKRFHFKPESGARSVEVSNGHVSRTFERDKEPFDVTEREANLLHGVADLEEMPAEDASQSGNNGREVGRDEQGSGDRDEDAGEHHGGGAGEEDRHGDDQD